MRVLVCGSRSWTNREVIREQLSQLPADTVVIHGDCRGADRLAAGVAAELGFDIEAYPADWEEFGRAAGPIRNDDMLYEGKPDRVIAFHHELNPTQGGTGDMIRKARRHGIPVVVVAELVIDY